MIEDRQIFSDKDSKLNYSLTDFNDLTGREWEVLCCLITRAMTPKPISSSDRAIAEDLGVERSTVKTHFGRMCRKVGARNKTALAVRALRTPGLI